MQALITEVLCSKAFETSFWNKIGRRAAGTMTLAQGSTWDTFTLYKECSWGPTLYLLYNRLASFRAFTDDLNDKLFPLM